MMKPRPPKPPAPKRPGAGGVFKETANKASGARKGKMSADTPKPSTRSKRMY
jgi:hypothetical protein